MPINNPTATIFSVAPDSSLNGATVQQVTAIPLTLATGYVYSIVVTAQVGPKTYLFAYGRGLAAADVFECSAVAPFLVQTTIKLPIGMAKDMLNVFTLGNQTYLSVYAAEKGIFQIYAVNADLSLSRPYEFYRNHELALTQDFSTLAFFTQFGQVVALGYREDTGYVAAYTVSIVATSTDGILPLLMTPVWSHAWAPGWTRFAFFQFGGEQFFLKTNVKKLNVNIDHVLDTLSAGTAEVGTLLQKQLPDALKLTNVAPLLLNAVDPWFVTYIESNGDATLNRIHSDCLGWTQGASFTAPTIRATVTPVVVGGKTFLIFI